MSFPSLLDNLLTPPIDTVLMDLDGTVYHVDHAVPGAIEFLRELERRNIRYACLSNSGSSPRRVRERLAGMGVNIDESHIYTAGVAAADYVMEHFGSQGRPRVFNLATRGVGELLSDIADFIEHSDQPCDVVVAGDPTSALAAEDRQRTALALLRSGAKLVGICADRVYPSPRGLEFGVGAMSAMLAYAAGVKPVFCGKPERFFFLELCRRLGAEPSRCVLVGDNLESDIAGARGVGMRCILVLTGVASREDVAHLPADLRPDWVVPGLPDLLR
jgi:HAD superfamily hydrolase (TIGR01450 family)